MKVAIDIDGVLGDFVSFCFHVMYREFDIDQFVVSKELGWDIIEGNGIDRDEFWELWEKGRANLENVPPMLENIRAINLVDLKDYEPYFVTARHDSFGKKRQTYNWLCQYLKFDNSYIKTHLKLTSDKPSYMEEKNIKYLVDDRPKNVRNTLGKGRVAYLHLHLHNKRFAENNEVPVVGSLAEFFRKIRSKNSAVFL